jgi:uncharacterized protein (DUF885 family)
LGLSSSIWPVVRLAWLALLTACPPAPLPPPRDPPKPPPVTTPDDGLKGALSEAAEGVRDAGLAALLREHWAFALESEPTWATTLGVHAFDDDLPDRSPEGFAHARARTRGLLERAKTLDASKLDAADALTLELFRSMLDDAVASEVCRFEQWNVDARENPITAYNDLQRIQPLRSHADGQRLLARYRKVPQAIDDAIANLRLGAKRGAFATAESARRVVVMVDEQLAKKIDDWPMMAPATKLQGVTPAQREAFTAELRASVEAVAPALRRYRDVLSSEILPRARGDGDSGLDSIPDGAACYAARVRYHTTLPLDPREVHELGMQEIARTDAEFVEVGKRVLGTNDVSTTIAALRSDKKLYFTSAEEVLADARSALTAAKGAMPIFFGRVPKTDCIVIEMPAHEAPFSTIAYYRPAHTDGSKPGEYVVNTYRPETRPRFEARVLAVHEAIPGHHLQIALAQEQGGVPAFRKHGGGIDAYVEGWALYTERLAEEMDLYRDDRDRLGMVSFDAWRAGRLVVDTGIHALGWSRELAKKFLLAHTALTPENIDNEVDRYIATPAQALAYKIGQREILALRKKAETALGAKFSRPSFHDMLLGAGALPLPLLRARADAWIAATAKQ